MQRRVQLSRFLGVVVIAALIAFGYGAGLSRGYFMRFFVNGSEISREGFLQKSEAGEALACTSGFSFPQGYVDQCFDTEAALEQYMAKP